MNSENLSPDTPEIRQNAVYTLKETCILLKIGDSTVRRWIKEGLLPARRIGRDYRFLGGDLLAALRHPKAFGWSFPDEFEGLRDAKAANRIE